MWLECPNPVGAAQHRRAGELHLARLQHDRLVERKMTVPVVLAEEDAEKDGVVGKLHRHTHFSALRPAARMLPSQTARRHRATESRMFSRHRAIRLSVARLSVCRLKEEKVV